MVDAQGRAHNAVEPGHRRCLQTVFGEVTVSRLAYRAKGAANLHVADAELNLPAERHSHGLRRVAAIEATRGSYQEASAAITRQTGVSVGKRQVEALAASCSVDFEAFYQAGQRPAGGVGEAVVITVDGKGIVMRPEALRSQTAQAAARSKNKLKGRLSKGEKANRKRMAEVGAVYTVDPVPRTPEDVMARSSGTTPKQAPRAGRKWVTASVVDDAAAVVADVFDQAALCDPEKRCDWVALVDGNRHQIDRIERVVRMASRGPLFVFLNVSAMHQPNRYYVPGAAEDSRETHAAALTYVDGQMDRLFAAMTGRGRPCFAIVCSDHGTAYGEGGHSGHRVAVEVVWTVPYAHFVVNHA